MKIRMDFVTNSSSTSFGAASVGVLMTAITSAIGISSAYASSKATSELSNSDNEPNVSDNESVEIFKPYDLVHSNISYKDKINKLDEKIEDYQKEWNEIKDTISKEDYETTKKSYDDYTKYLNDMKKEADYVEYNKEIQKIAEEASKEYKEQWIENKKNDLASTREQIEFLDAAIRGYGGSGFDTSEIKKQLKMYKNSENDIVKSLAKEKIEYNYKAQKRDSIGPSKNMLDYVKQRQEEKQRQIDLNKKAKKKAILMKINKSYQEEADAYIKFSNTADKYLKGAEAIQTGADIAIDSLENVTGPLGKEIKIIYVGAKGIASGIGEATAEGGNYTANISKGIIKGSADVIKELTSNKAGMMIKGGKKYGKYLIYTKEAVTISSEAVMGGIDAAKNGKSIIKGMVKGTFKGTLDVGGDSLADKFLPGAKSLPTDFSKISGKSFVKGIIGGNPILRESVKNMIKDSIKNNTLNQAKNFAKGEGIIFGDWKHGLY